MKQFSLAIHGGAGTIVKADMTPGLEAAYRQAMEDALKAGYLSLEAGEPAETAVVKSVMSLEDNPMFNAGRGSVFTKKGNHEMDASVMRGRDLAAGAVAAITHVKNPIMLASEIMLHSEHVFLVGSGANEFALERGLKFEPDSYFFSQYRFDQWKAVRDSDNYALDHNVSGIDALLKNKKFGTVGAVALDVNGNIAAATSTGGMTNKRYSRIGDTPVIGAGTYANNKTCAVSCTGHGELFIKAVAAYDVSCLIEYKGLSLQQAMEEVVMKKLVAINGEGGMIGIDTAGNTAMLFNSEGMYRAMQSSNGKKEVAIYK